MPVGYNQEIFEVIDIVPGFTPVDMSTGANNGLWVNMALIHRVGIVLFKGVGTAAQDPTITLNQATDNLGTGSKALSSITRARTKSGATLTQTTLATETIVTQAAASTFTVAGSANQIAIWMLEIREGDLDVANGFNHIQAAVADVGANAQIGALFYIAAGGSYLGSLPINVLN